MSKIDYRPLETRLKKDLKKQKITAKELEDMDFDVIDFDESKFDKKQLKEFKKMMKIRSPLAKDYVKIKTLIKYKKEKHIVKLIDEFNAKAEQVNKIADFLGVLNEFKVETLSISILREKMFVDYELYKDGVNPKNLELLKEKEEQDRIEREALEKELGDARENKTLGLFKDDEKTIEIIDTKELINDNSVEIIKEDEEIILDGDEINKTIKIDDNSVIQLEDSNPNDEDNMIDLLNNKIDDVPSSDEESTNESANLISTNETKEEIEHIEEEINEEDINEKILSESSIEKSNVIEQDKQMNNENSDANINNESQIINAELQDKHRKLFDLADLYINEKSDIESKEINSVKEEIDAEIINQTADSFNFENDSLKAIVNDVKNYIDERILQATSKNDFDELNSTYDLEIEDLPEKNNEYQITSNEIRDAFTSHIAQVSNIPKETNTSEWTEGLNTENIETSMSEIDNMISSVDEFISNMKEKVHNNEEIVKSYSEKHISSNQINENNSFKSVYEQNNSNEEVVTKQTSSDLESKIILLQREIELLKHQNNQVKEIRNEKLITQDDIRNDSIEGVGEINKKLNELSSFISSYDVRSKKEIEEEQSIYESLIKKYMYNNK